MPQPGKGAGRKRYRNASPEPGTTRRSVRLPNYMDREIARIAEERGMYFSQVLKSVFDQGKGARLPIITGE